MLTPIYAAARRALFEPRPRSYLVVGAALLVLEAALCVRIVRTVPYTEIDWVAYMQEVGGAELLN